VSKASYWIENIRLYYTEEANFNWPAYLLGDEYQQPIGSIGWHEVKE